MTPGVKDIELMRVAMGLALNEAVRTEYESPQGT